MSGTDLVQVASSADLPEAQLIQGLLESEGIASIRRPVGVDGTVLVMSPLPSGAQRVLVAERQAEDARRVLAETLGEPELDLEPETANARNLAAAEGRGPGEYGLAGAWVRIGIWSVVTMGGLFALFVLLHS